MVDPVAAVLGLSLAGPLPLMSAVGAGLPLAALDRVAGTVAPADGKFAHRIVPRATLARRRRASTDARLSAEEDTRLARLASVWALALDVWGGKEAVRRFLFEPHMLLHGRSPVDVVLENELGRPVVEVILRRLQYGSAV